MKLVTVQGDYLILSRSEARDLGFSFDLDGDICAQLCPPNNAGNKDIIDADKISTIINCLAAIVKQKYSKSYIVHNYHKKEWKET